MRPLVRGGGRGGGGGGKRDGVMWWRRRTKRSPPTHFLPDLFFSLSPPSSSSSSSLFFGDLSFVRPPPFGGGGGGRAASQGKERGGGGRGNRRRSVSRSLSPDKVDVRKRSHRVLKGREERGGVRRNPAARRRATETQGSHRARAMDVQKKGPLNRFFFHGFSSGDSGKMLACVGGNSVQTSDG